MPVMDYLESLRTKESWMDGCQCSLQNPLDAETGESGYSWCKTIQCNKRNQDQGEMQPFSSIKMKEDDVRET